MINPPAHWKKVACVGLTAGGFALGLFVGHQSQETVVATQLVEDVEIKQQLAESLKTERLLREQLLATEKTLSELKTSTTEKVRIVYRSNGTRVVERVKATNSSLSVDSSRSAAEVRGQQEVSTQLRTASTAASHGLSDPGLQFKYRFLNLGKASFWVSAEVIRPTDPQPRLGLGLSF